MSDDVFPVVVIGGGLAGLTAALHLAERDIPPLVLETDALWAGGRLSGGEPDTFDYAGRTWSFPTSHGMHALWGNYVNMRALLHRLNIPIQPSPGEEWINRWGREVRVIEAGNAIRSRWIPAPFHYLQLLFNPQIWNAITPLDFLSLPGFLASVLWTVGFDPLKEQRPLDGLMMKDFFRGWTPNLKATFTGLGANLLAAHPDDISLTAYIAALRFYTMLRRDSWRMDYLYADSHEALIQPLTERIQSCGGQVMYGTEALAIEQHESGWRVRVEDSLRGGIRSLVAAHVILALDSPGVTRLFANSPDLSPEAEKLFIPPALRNTTVRLWFKSSPREGTPGGMMTGEFVPDNFFWLHRLFDDFREWHEVTGGSAIEVHLYGSPSLLDLPERNLIIHAVDEVQRAFPALRGHFVHGAVRSNSRTQTQFRVPTHDSLHVWTPWTRLYACGDWIGYDTPAFWMERSVITAMAAANAVLNNYDRESYPILSPPPPELLARMLGGLVHLLRRVLSPIITPLFRLPGRLRRALRG